MGRKLNSYKKFSTILMLYGILCCEGTQSEHRLSATNRTSMTISTTLCDVRVDEYQARLDLFYVYKIVYEENTLDLLGIENAIATSIATSLKKCDRYQQPLFAVELNSPSHREIDTIGHLCDSILPIGQKCSVIRGETSILLDNQVGNINEDVTATIETTIGDTTFLSQFSSTNISEVSFVYSIGENLVVLVDPISSKVYPSIGENTSSASSSLGIARIILVTMSLAVVLAGIFVYGYFRNHNDLSKADYDRSARTNYLFRTQRRQYFEELTDDPSLVPSWKVPVKNKEEPTTKPESATWSVSDLTSDTQSIKESLPMERIDEECPNDADGYDDTDGGSSTASANTHASSALTESTNPSIREKLYSLGNRPTVEENDLGNSIYPMQGRQLTYDEESATPQSTSSPLCLGGINGQFIHNNNFIFRSFYCSGDHGEQSFQNFHSIEQFDAVPEGSMLYDDSLVADDTTKGSYPNMDEASPQNNNTECHTTLKSEIHQGTPEMMHLHSQTKRELKKRKLFESESSFVQEAMKEEYKDLQEVHAVPNQSKCKELFVDSRAGSLVYSILLKLEQSKSQKLIAY